MSFPRGAARLLTLLIAAGLISYSLFSLRLESRSVIFETRLLNQAEAGERPRSNLAKLRLLTQCIRYVRSNYVSPDRIRPIAMLVGALKSVESLVPDVMVTTDTGEPETARTVTVRVGENTRTFSLSGTSDLYEMSWKLLDIFDFLAPLLPKDVKEDEVEYATINGLLSPLDEHSVFLPPKAYKEMKMDTEGKFGGLGIVITTRNGLVTVVSVLPGTPADKAGLKAMDQITDIGDESTMNMLLTDAVSKLRGKPGTEVTIRVLRKGWAEPRTFTLTRAEIKIESVTSEVLGRGVGYVRIRNFQENTRKDLVMHLKSLSAKGSLERLILDLRENPGGLLEQSVEVADLFLTKGTIVVTQGEGNRMRQEYEASRDAPFASVPMVVLVDGGTASAAEIVAAALKGNDRAVLIGDTTFGKGTVQVLYEVGEGALKLTVAQYLTPGGYSIQGVGIVPDIDLVPVTVQDGELSLGTREQRAERDPKRKLRPFGPISDEEPKIHLPVFVEAEKETDEDEEPPVREERFVRDEIISIAEELVLAMKTPKRGMALREASGVVSNIAARQDARIAKALRERGIDWTAGPPQPAVPLELSWKLEDGRVLRSGMEARVRLTARNPASVPLYRVHVTTVTDHPALDGLEFVFGKIEPGQVVTRERKVKVGAEMWDRLDRVDFVVYQGDVEGLKPPPIMVATRSSPKPRFAYTVRVQDDAGDGDGLLDPGETADLLLQIVNVGEGPAKEVLATLRNQSGEAVYVRQGRRTFKGGIQPGQSIETRFSLEVRAARGLEEVKVEIGVLDTKTREYMSTLHIFPISKNHSGAFERFDMGLRVTSDHAEVLAAASEDAAVLYRVPKGFLLRGLARRAEFLKVEVEPGEFAFVRSRDVEPVSEPVRYPALPVLPDNLAWMPAIKIEPSNLAEWKERGTLRLTGAVRFEGKPSNDMRRKVLVFRGTDKVFFWWGQSGVGDALEVPIDVAIPLEPGRNDIAVYAVEGSDRAATRRLTIYNQEGAHSAKVGQDTGGEP